MKLIQFQCQREGTLFYYQTSIQVPSNRHFIAHCPVCGSKRIQETGRVFPAVAEDRPIKKGRPS